MNETIRTAAANEAKIGLGQQLGEGVAVCGGGDGWGRYPAHPLAVVEHRDILQLLQDMLTFILYFLNFCRRGCHKIFVPSFLHL